MADLQVPGFEMGARIGAGRSGEVWAARDSATGDAVMLRSLRLDLGGGDLDRRDRVRRDAARLAGLSHPHLVHALRLVSADAGLVLVSELVDGVSLDRVLRSGRVLAAGEVVTVGAPLAQALAVAHRRGVVHGDLSAGDVLLTDDGRPLLCGLGVAQLRTGTRREPADDVAALGSLLLRASTAPAVDPRHPPVDAARLPRALRDLLTAAIDQDPGRRPSAAELGRGLLSAAQPVPVRLRPGGPRTPPGDPVPAEPNRNARPPVARPRPAARSSPGRGGRRRRPSVRRRVADSARVAARRGRAGSALVALLLLVAAAGGGWAWARSTGSDGPTVVPRAAVPPVSVTNPARTGRTGPARSTGSPDGRGPQPATAALADLDRRRAEAYARADPEALARLYEPGSAAGRRDTRRVAALRRSALRPEGMRLVRTSVRPVRRDGTEVVLRVTDTLSAWRLVDRLDRVRRESPGRGERTWLVTLVRRNGAWRYAAVRPDPGAVSRPAPARPAAPSRSPGGGR